MPGRAHLRNPDPPPVTHPPPAFGPLLLFSSRGGFRSLIPCARFSAVLVRSSLPSRLSRAHMGLDVGEIGLGLDLGLDLSLFAARSAGGLAAATKGAPAGIESCIRSLEVERRKIEMFRRELPLCVRLLADVIEELKEEAAKRGGGAEPKPDDGDKRKWMSTAQLWVDTDAKSEESGKVLLQQQGETISSPEPKLLAPTPMPIRAVAMVPPLPPPAYFRTEEDSSAAGTVGLSLSPPVKTTQPSPTTMVASDEHRQSGSARFSTTVPPPSGSGLNLHAQTQQQSRKARRCWSPELHRQFVAALHQLGGPQVATPKQIREVMQVDGLTNDEVKSHLQKYRLHNRRSPGVAPVSQSIMLVGGGLWVSSQDQSSSQSGSPQGPLQFSGSGVAASAATVGGGDSSSSSSSDEDDKCDEGYSRK